jgi:hypothetical protein
MKLSYATLSKNYDSSDINSLKFKSASDLYASVGIDLDNLIEQSPGYRNTCATRVSLALIKSGVPLNGRLSIKSGPYVGKKLETGAKLLADELMKPEMLGRPEIHKPDAFLGKIKGRRGIVFFYKIEAYGAGSGSHIDLIDHSTASAVCASACYYNSKEIWFWPLKD